MPKVNIRVSLKNSDSNITKEITGIFHDDQINYIEEDNTKIVFNYNNKTLQRETNDLRMNFLFDTDKETILKINYKKLDMDMEIPIKTNKIEIQNKNIEIEYEIQNELEKEIIIYRIEEIK